MSPVFDNFGRFVDGFQTSLWICFLGMIGSMILGTIIAGCRVSPIPPLQAFGTAYVTIFRNSPLTVVLFMMAFGMPELGINISYFTFGIVGLILYTSAFVCEALRGGINAVDPGQAEAARAIGLPFAKSLREVVLPQAFRSSVPPVGSVIIAMFKNSAVVGAFGVGGDLYSEGNRLIGAGGFAALPIFLGVAVGYLIITLTAGVLLGVIERRVAILR